MFYFYLNLFFKYGVVTVIFEYFKVFKYSCLSLWIRFLLLYTESRINKNIVSCIIKIHFHHENRYTIRKMCNSLRQKNTLYLFSLTVTYTQLNNRTLITETLHKNRATILKKVQFAQTCHIT